jgi:hypothetical protein
MVGVNVFHRTVAAYQVMPSRKYISIVESLIAKCVASRTLVVCMFILDLLLYMLDHLNMFAAALIAQIGEIIYWKEIFLTVAVKRYLFVLVQMLSDAD